MLPGSLKRVATEDGSVSPPATKRKIQTSTTSEAVANFFKPSSEKEPSKALWRTVDDSLLVCTYDKKDDFKHIKPRKIAAFDFDSTLITTTSGKKFGRDAQDWRWWHAVVEKALRDLVAEGYLVAIISNQAGLSLDKNSKTALSDGKRLSQFKAKAAAVLTALDLPITLYAATRHDHYRKPRAGMWAQLLKDYDLTDSASVDLGTSYFVGDAGGRTATGGRSKDFSCSDRDLAANIGIKFHTPEEFFLGEEPRPFARTFDPAQYVDIVLATSTNVDPISFIKKNSLDIVLFVGSPGAGKSTFYWKHLEPLGCERINQDILKSRDRCLKEAEGFLREGKSVAIDNTNADIDTRKNWFSLAAKLSVPVRCVLFTAPAKLCEHNDTVRALGGTEMNPESRTMLPKVAFTGFASRYREPDMKEGFQDIVRVDFRFTGNETQRALWRKYWISSS